MPLFSVLDLVALAWFVGAWAIYSAILSLTERSRQGLNSEMNRYRDVWMFQMLARHAHGRRPDRGGVAERHRILRLNLADRDRRRADAVAVVRRDPRGGRGAAVRRQDD